MKLNDVQKLHHALDANANNNLSQYIDLYAFVSENLILTYNGTLIACFELQGIDPEGLTSEEMDRQTRSFGKILQEFDRKCVVYHWLHRKKVDVSLQETGQELYDHFVRRRRATYESKQFFENKIYVALEFPVVQVEDEKTLKEKFPALVMEFFDVVKEKRLMPFFKEKFRQTRSRKERKIELEVQKLFEVIEDTVNPCLDSFGIQLRNFHPRLLPYQEFFEVLLPITTPDRLKQKLKLTTPGPLNYYLDNGYDFSSGKHLQIDGYFVDILTLRQCGKNMYFRMLEAFEDLDFEFILNQQWRRVSDEKAERAITLQRRAFNNGLKISFSGKNDNTETIKQGYKTQVVDYLDHALTELKEDGNWFGKYSMAIMFWAETEEEMTRRKAKIRSLFYELDMMPFDENMGLIFAWMAMIPGGFWKYNYRKLLMSNLNFAALAPTWKLDAGNPTSKAYKGECLSILETRTGNPYFFNLSHSDNLNFMALGKIGSGKSFFLKYHIIQYFKYGPSFFWLHTLGSDYNDLARMAGGQVIELDPNGSFPINLYCLEDELSPGYLTVLIHVWEKLFECNDHQMTEPEREELVRKIPILFKQPKANRTNRALFDLVDHSLKNYIGPFVWDDDFRGQYGRLFDGQVNDPRAFSSLGHFTVIDYKGIVKQNPLLANACMIFISYMQDQIIYSAEKKSINKFVWLDEGDKIIGDKDSYMGHYIRKGGDTWRKENCSLGFITQRLDHLKTNNLLTLFRECCSQFLFFPNPGISEKDYGEAFDFMTPREIELVKSMEEKREVLLVTTYGVSKVLRLVVDDFTRFIIESDPHLVARKEILYEEFGFPANIHRLIEEEKAKTIIPTSTEKAFGLFV